MLTGTEALAALTLAQLEFMDAEWLAMPQSRRFFRARTGAGGAPCLLPVFRAEAAMLDPAGEAAAMAFLINLGLVLLAGLTGAAWFVLGFAWLRARALRGAAGDWPHGY